jgi:hypothetical protein
MKTLSSMLAFALLLVSLSASGQQGNTISFSNLDLIRGINAPFFDSDGATRLAGENYRASLYIGPVGTPTEFLFRVGPAQPFRTGTSAGYWQPANIQVPGVVPGAPILAQVRFWDTQGGTLVTFEEAQGSGAKIGFSSVLQLNLLPSGTTPLTGLRSASLIPVMSEISLGETRTLNDTTTEANGLTPAALCETPVGVTRWAHVTFSEPGDAVIQTTGSVIDTVLAVSTNCLSLQEPVWVGCNNDLASGQTASEVRFQARTNVTYAVVVGGVNGASGAIQVTAFLQSPVGISAITNRIINQNESTGPIAFTVSGPSPSTLIVNAVSSNPSLIRADSITFAGSGNSRTVAVTPLLDQSGTATITLMVRNASGGTATTSFLITVVPVNDVMRLHIVREMTNTTVTWTATNGVLQHSIGLGGEWSDVLPEAKSPYLSTTDVPTFYRLRTK